MKDDKAPIPHQQLLLDTVHRQCTRHSIGVMNLIKIIPAVAKAADYGINVNILIDIINCTIRDEHSRIRILNIAVQSKRIYEQPPY